MGCRIFVLVLFAAVFVLSASSLLSCSVPPQEEKGVITMEFKKTHPVGSPETGSTEKTGGKVGLSSAASSVNAFSVELFKAVKEEKEGVFVSPISVMEALYIACLGARGGTKEAMLKTLSLSGIPDPGKALRALRESLLESARDTGIELDIEDALWVQKGFSILEGFMEDVRGFCGGLPMFLDFVRDPVGSVDAINRWVKERTKGKIDSLLSSGDVDEATRLVITNAIYFKGLWERAFDRKCTKNLPFYLEDGGSVTVPMMHRKGRFLYGELSSGIKILSMPYKGGSFEFVAVLPGRSLSLEDLKRRMSWKTLELWISSMRKEEVSVFIPRFKMDIKSYLKDPLSKLGMGIAFTDGADFSGITGKKDLEISRVVHRAYISVDEEGTEAAAATGVVMRLTAFMPPKEKVFRADHPFIFFVFHRKSGAILFMGEVLNPKASM